jgi:hypothetical protein
MMAAHKHINARLSIHMSIIKLAEENGVSKKKIQQILQKEAKTVDARTGELLRYDDLLKATIDVDFVVRLEQHFSFGDLSSENCHSPKKSQRSHDSTPDILHSGHVHNIDVQNYLGTLIVNSGAWQAQTKYQQMMGIVPSPGIAIIVNLANLQPFQMNFNQSNPI